MAQPGDMVLWSIGQFIQGKEHFIHILRCRDEQKDNFM